MAKSSEPKNQEQIAQLREKATAIGHNVQEIGRISKDMAHDTMDVLKDNAGEYYQQGMDKAKGLEKDLEAKIKKNPLQSLLIALGLGFLVGILLRRH